MVDKENNPNYFFCNPCSAYVTKNNKNRHINSIKHINNNSEYHGNKEVKKYSKIRGGVGGVGKLKTEIKDVHTKQVFEGPNGNDITRKESKLIDDKKT